MLTEFKSMNDLSDYLTRLESRIKTLEFENERLRTSMVRMGGEQNAIMRSVTNSLPRTNLLSPGFLSRAFAVWGHFFVANLLISLIAGAIIGVFYLCMIFTIFGAILGNSR